MPWLYQKYVGHDNNRDMYMFTQVESQLTAKLLWHDWFPAVWLDEHQQGSSGARIFVMPATDPINPNVHPLIYRWNGIFGQTQGAALEAAGKDGIIYNSTYTNFWQGAMAWSGWWHNQVGPADRGGVGARRVADRAAARGTGPSAAPPAAEGGRRGGGARTGDAGRARCRRRPTSCRAPSTRGPGSAAAGRCATSSTTSSSRRWRRSNSRPTSARRCCGRSTRSTARRSRAGRKGDPSAILIAPDTQPDPLAAYRLVDRLQIGGVKVYRADAAFKADDKDYPAGTFVVPMTQVFARYAKDLLEKQTYPEVRRSPTSPPEPPYDVTAWSLGMLLGVDVDVREEAAARGRGAHARPAVAEARRRR